MTNEAVALTGWGLTMPTRAAVSSISSAAELAPLLAGVGNRGVIARGAGRSYGDAAQNGGGLVVTLDAINDVEVLDDGDVVAGAGALLADVIAPLLARGRFLPVTPGTRFVTVGGAIAADVHGKNHHVDGSFGQHLRWLDLVVASGQTQRIGPDGSPDDVALFHATVGGMGLTGIIVRACFGSVESPTDQMNVDTYRCADLDSLMSQRVEREAGHRYSVAWLDGMARGGKLGRGVLTVANHALTNQTPTNHALSGGTRPTESQLAMRFAAPRINVPPVPVSPLNRVTLAAFNEGYYRAAPRVRTGQQVGLGSYFYPLDLVGGWNRLYGSRGFVQYQFAVPDSGAAVIRQALERLSSIGAPSFLSVLKRFGAGNSAAPLSFPIAGWTLAIDVPARLDDLGPILDELDDAVLVAGGRLYLAKDSRATPAVIAAGYPRLDEFRSIRQGIDPAGIFTSDLARRLAL